MYSLTLMLTDLLIYVMPMPIIWKLRMTTRRKIETILVFMVGLVYVDSTHFGNDGLFLTAATVSASRE